MRALIVGTMLTVLCGLSGGFYDTSQGKTVEDMLMKYVIASQKYCLLEGQTDLVEGCEIPVDDHMIPVNDDMVSLPIHSVCKLKGLHPKMNSCIICRGAAWETGSCTTGFIRQKRFFWFFVGFFVGAACAVLCVTGPGGEKIDHRPPKFSKCDKPSSSVFYADRGKTSTTVTWPEPEATDVSGNKITPTLIQGHGNPGSEFGEGLHYFAYKATDSHGYSDYCFISFEVKVRKCTLNWIRHGNRNCDNNNYIYGATCQIGCDDGYKRHGVRNLICEENGWDHTIPKCKPKECPVLSGNFQCTETYNYGSICSLSCNRSKGLSVTNPSITVCLKSGKWFIPVPQCVDSNPPVFDNCPKTSIVKYADSGAKTATVTWEGITATDNSGKVTVTQMQGHTSGSVFPSGTSVIEYKATDGEGNQAQCIFNVVVQVLTCGPPPYTDTKMRFECTNQYVYGSQCSVSCVGALLNGSNIITCQKDNGFRPQMYWQTSTVQPPFCIQNKCDSLSPPENGALTCDTNLAGSFCVMSCNTNWDIPISALSVNMYQCGWSSGTWFPSSNVPDCTAKRVPKEMRLPSKLQYYTGSCNESATLEQIKENHVKVLNSSALFYPNGCLANGVCSVKNVEVRCGTTTRRRRDLHGNTDGRPLHFSYQRPKRSVGFISVTWDFTVNYHCGTRSTAECFTYLENILVELRDITKQMLENGDFDPSIPGVSVGNDSYNYGSVELQCGEGMKAVYSSGTCAVCPTGTKFNKTSADCMDCPIGSYQDEDHSFSCKNCPQGTTTLFSGSRSVTDCKDMCRPGNISATGIEPCAPCPVGGYQSQPGSTSCVTCPVGTTTEKTGAAASGDCEYFDMAIRGPSTLTSSMSTAEAVNSFTLFLWVKVSTPSSGLNIAFTNDNIKLQIDNTLTASLQGNQAVTGIPIDVNKWLPIAVVFDYSSKQLTVYKSGQTAATATVSTVSSPVIVTASTLTVNCTSTEGVIIRSLSFIKASKTFSEIKVLSTTCSVITDNNTIINMEDMNGGTTEKASVIIPSTCDATDECFASDPCNGHPCVNTHESYTCQCQEGYTGDSCMIPPDFCYSHRCENGATCVSGQTNYTCKCAAGFKGQLCEAVTVNGDYSPWADWSACPVTCGGGVVTRSRSCTNPPPDVDGTPCSGPNVETRDCNTDPCPVCESTQLQLGANNLDSGPSCTGNATTLSCVAQCKSGFYLSRGQVSGYNCSNGNWIPSTQLPSCLKVISPTKLTLKAEVSFKSPGCPSAEEVENIKSSLETKAGILECGKLSTCDRKIDITGCSELTSTTTATITFTVNLPEADLHFDPSATIETLSPELRILFDAIKTLKTTAQQLEEDAAILEVTSGGVTYTPVARVKMTSDVTCAPGYFVEDGLCGSCPAGTYHVGHTKRCEFCPMGQYQELTGQVDCKICPTETSTQYFGSVQASKCDGKYYQISTLTSPSTTKESEGDLTSTKKTVIIVCSVVGALTLVFLVTTVVLCLKKANGSDKVRCEMCDAESSKQMFYSKYSETNSITSHPPVFHGL